MASYHYQQSQDPGGANFSGVPSVVPIPGNDQQPHVYNVASQFPQNPNAYSRLNESAEDYNYIDDDYETSLEYDDGDESRCSEDGAMSLSGAIASGLDQLGTPHVSNEISDTKQTY